MTARSPWLKRFVNGPQNVNSTIEMWDFLLLFVCLILMTLLKPSDFCQAQTWTDSWILILKTQSTV